MLSIYLLVMGLLLGYLAEQQKHLRAEKAVITGTLSRVRVEAGLTGTIEQIFSEIMSMYGPSRVMIASQETHSHRVFAGEMSKPNGSSPAEFHWLESGIRDAKKYLDNFPGEVCYASVDRDQWKTLALDETGNQVPMTRRGFAVSVSASATFDSLVTVPFLFGGDGEGGFFYSIPRGVAKGKRNCVFFWTWFARWGRRSTTFIFSIACAAARAPPNARALRANSTTAPCSH